MIHDLKWGFSRKSTICDFLDELRHVCYLDQRIVLFGTLWSRVLIGTKIGAPTDCDRAITAALSRLFRILKTFQRLIRSTYHFHFSCMIFNGSIST